MKFRFYITSLDAGAIRGTNDEAGAASCAASEDYFVVDAETGEWLQPDSVRVPVEGL